jgi:hypothetical protein
MFYPATFAGPPVLPGLEGPVAVGADHDHGGAAAQRHGAGVGIPVPPARPSCRWSRPRDGSSSASARAATAKRAGSHAHRLGRVACHPERRRRDAFVAPTRGDTLRLPPRTRQHAVRHLHRAHVTVFGGRDAHLAGGRAHLATRGGVGRAARDRPARHWHRERPTSTNRGIVGGGGEGETTWPMTSGSTSGRAMVPHGSCWEWSG